VARLCADPLGVLKHSSDPLVAVKGLGPPGGRMGRKRRKGRRKGRGGEGSERQNGRGREKGSVPPPFQSNFHHCIKTH